MTKDKDLKLTASVVVLFHSEHILCSSQLELSLSFLLSLGVNMTSDVRGVHRGRLQIEVNDHMSIKNTYSVLQKEYIVAFSKSMPVQLLQ